MLGSPPSQLAGANLMAQLPGSGRDGSGITSSSLTSISIIHDMVLVAAAARPTSNTSSMHSSGTDNQHQMPISPASDSPPPANAQLRAKAATSRQQKKRELDRRAQRLSRERTKARIAHLEQLVEEFRDKDTSGQVRVLTEQLQTVTKQRDALTGLLRTLQSSIKQHITPESDYSVELSPAHVSRETAASRGGNLDGTADIYSPCEDASSSLSAAPGGQGAAYANEPAIEALDEFHGRPAFPELMSEPVHDVPALMDDFFPDLSEQLIVPTPSFDDPIVPAATPACDCYHSHQLTAPSWQLNLWRFANEVLTPQPQAGENNPLPDYEFEYDVPIRAIVEGWPAVEARLGTLPESWRKLRAVDQVLFNACGSVERLAILRMMYSLLMYHSEPSPERRAALPAWYLQRYPFIHSWLYYKSSSRTDILQTFTSHCPLLRYRLLRMVSIDKSPEPCH